MRRMPVDLPRPGLPSTNADGLEIRWAVWNQEIGSQHKVAPVVMCRPNGTPTIGVPEPATHGHNPHTCLVVPRNSTAGAITDVSPRPRPSQPSGPGRAATRCRFPARRGFLLLDLAFRAASWWTAEGLSESASAELVPWTLGGVWVVVTVCP